MNGVPVQAPARLLFAAPRYFSLAISLGVLTQIGNAFGQVQGSLSWFVESYGSLASWKATVDRLLTFPGGNGCRRPAPRPRVARPRPTEPTLPAGPRHTPRRSGRLVRHRTQNLAPERFAWPQLGQNIRTLPPRPPADERTPVYDRPPAPRLDCRRRVFEAELEATATE